MFEYFRDKVYNDQIIYLQETHFCKDALNKWRDDFYGQMFFFSWNCEFLWCNDRLSWKQKKKK